MYYGCVPRSRNWLPLCLFSVTSFTSIHSLTKGKLGCVCDVRCVCVCTRVGHVWMDGPLKSCVPPPHCIRLRYIAYDFTSSVSIHLDAVGVCIIIRSSSRLTRSASIELEFSIRKTAVFLFRLSFIFILWRFWFDIGRGDFCLCSLWHLSMFGVPEFQNQNRI